MASGQATPSHVLSTGVELSVPCSEIHPLFYMPCIQGFVTRWYLHECEAFAGENMGFVRHSPVQMIAYMEHCGGKIHIRLLGKRRETLITLALKNLPAALNVDAITFNKLGLVAYRGCLVSFTA